jgi:segregation and condensation protein A
MATAAYTVRLDAFQGPLDLLLHLIHRAELDITEISVARIADDYVRHLGTLTEIDVDDAGEFLVLAATLIEIKSRLVSPDPTSTDGETSLGEDGSDDPASLATDLVRQLLRYKSYRDAADMLARRHAEWQDRFPAAAAGADLSGEPEPALDLDDVAISDLFLAFQRILETVQFDRLGEHRVVDDDTPIELHAAGIISHLESAAGGIGAPVPFRSIFLGKTRSEAVGMFIALLELVRQRRIRVQQPTPGAELMVIARTETDQWDEDHIFGDEDEPDDGDELRPA